LRYEEHWKTLLCPDSDDLRLECFGGVSFNLMVTRITQRDEILRTVRAAEAKWDDVVDVKLMTE